MKQPPENPVKDKDFQKVVERMLKTPPKPHVPPKHPLPAKKTAKKKPR